MRSFAELPLEVERALERHARVVLVLLDAFGCRFLDRYAEAHPLLRRLLAAGTLTPLETQFPSTTTAHVTTMHTGQPVWRHGLYEWNVYEPAEGRVVIPLRSPAPSLPPEPTLYERLGGRGVRCSVHQPAHFSPSAYDRVAARGADLRPYAEFPLGLADALAQVAAAERGYAYVYLDAIDTTGHVCGPSSREFDDTVRYVLDALETGLAGGLPQDTLLLLTADHGQVDVDPERALWLDHLWPDLREHLRDRPAGSARDVFLHVREPDAVIDGLRAALGDRAEVVPARSLFPTDAGPRLLERLADVCVLPEPGRTAWLRSHPDLQARFRGHHGGRTPEETRTFLLAVDGI